MRNLMRLCPVVTMGILATAALAQEGSGPNIKAREIFYGSQTTNTQTGKTQTAGARGTSGGRRGPIDSPSTGAASNRSGETKPPVTPVSVTALALRYRVLRQAGRGFEEVDTDTNFTSGDKIKISIAINDSAYVYIAETGSSGTWKILFPSKDLPGGTNLAAAQREIEIPPAENAWRFDETPGVEQVFIAASREPIDDLERAIEPTQPQSPGPPIQYVQLDRSVIAGLRSRDLVLTKEKIDNKDEHAIYVANAKDVNGPVIAQFDLKHRP